MPTTSSLVFPTRLEQHRLSGSPGAFTGDDDIAPTQAPPFPLTRNWTSLQQHAQTVRPVTPGGGPETPQPEGRREGYTWEVARGGEPDDSSSCRPFPPNPAIPPLPQITHDSRDQVPRKATVDIASSNSFEPRPLTERTSTAASFAGLGFSRHDTGRSSFGSIARGVMRHVPDMSLFNSDEKKPRKAAEHIQGSRARHPDKSGLTPSSELPPVLKRHSDVKSPRHVHELEGLERKSVMPNPQKGCLKDRRKLNQTEAMKLTLPLEMPDLPPRRRMSMVQAFNPQGLPPPRSRSPKTPWIRNGAATWDVPVDTPPATVKSPSANVDGKRGKVVRNDSVLSSTRIRKHINRPRHKRGQSNTSENTNISPLGAFALEEIQTNPINEAPPKAPEEPKQEGKRMRRWRWSGPRTSNDNASGESRPDEDLEGRCSFSQLFRPNKRMGQASPPISPFTKPAHDTIPGHRAQNSSYTDSNAFPLANMSAPPIFIPPGLKRVPTPVLDQAGDVQGKLADFVFELQAFEQPKPSRGRPGGVWDSDALLMSQHSNITPRSSPSDESPTKFTPTLTPLDTPGPSNRPTGLPTPIPTPQPSPYNPLCPTPNGEHPDWFRVSLLGDSERNLRLAKEAEERAKFEWLIPEHLPNSPLCPRSPKYRGPSRGICIFHDRQQQPSPDIVASGSITDPPSQSTVLPVDGESPGWDAKGIEKLWQRGFLARRRKRLVSCSSP